MGSSDALEALIIHARATWPGVPVPDDTFVAYLRERRDLSPPRDLAPPRDDAATDSDDTLTPVQAADLYIACACAHRIPAALEAFRQRFGPALRHAVRRNAPDAQVDDLTQQVWMKLFADADRSAITKYDGRGKLSTWVQTVATRHVLDAVRRREPTAAMDDGALLEQAIATDDPEIESLKRTYRDAFKRGFQHAFGQLSPRQRNIIRHELIDGMNIDQIGALYGVHRATVARWRITCRQALLHETLAYLKREHHVGQTEAASVMRLIESQLDVSLTRLLRDNRTVDG